MNNIYIFILYFVMLFFLMSVYFKLADRFNIIDKPNERSSHHLITVRGGGIIFSLSAVIYALIFGFPYPFFLCALLLICVVSFVDDIVEVNGYIRMVFQFISVIIIFFESSLLNNPVYLIVPFTIFAVAGINAWNFMDGINGLTGGYSLLVIFSLIYINDQVIPFTSTGFMVAIALSLLVFVFYNFRTQARCFAGDVGSVGVAVIILFLMIQLFIKTGNINFILFILIYGLDSTTTVFFRYIRKEHILKPHRSHLYQYLANEKGLPHNTVSMIYILIQAVINVLVIALKLTSLTSCLLIVFVSLGLFLAVRFYIEGKERLLKGEK